MCQAVAQKRNLKLVPSLQDGKASIIDPFHLYFIQKRGQCSPESHTLGFTRGPMSGRMEVLKLLWGRK